MNMRVDDKSICAHGRERDVKRNEIIYDEG
jgi:hypothetical protein